MQARRLWLLAGFMWFAFFLNSIDRQVVFSVFPVLKAELDFTDAQLGLTGSVFLWMYALASPAAGRIADRFSMRALVVLSLVLWSSATLLTGLCSSPAAFLSCRALVGVTEAFFYPAAVALMAGELPIEARSRAFALFGTSKLAGVVAGGSYGGYMAEAQDWRWAFLSLGVLGIVYAIPYGFFLRSFARRLAEAVPEKRAGTWPELFRGRLYLILLLVSGLFTFTQWFLYAWMPAHFYEKYRLDLAEAGLVSTACLQVPALVATIAGGILADRLYRRTRSARFWVSTAGLVLMSPCLGLLGAADSLALGKTAAIGVGLGSGLAASSLNISAFDVVPENLRASALGFINLVSGLASGFAPWAGGHWKASWCIDGMLGWAGVTCLAAGLLVVFGLALGSRRGVGVPCSLTGGTR